MKTFLVWNNNDPNDSFTIDGDDDKDAIINALSELGWSISKEAIDEDNEDME